MTNYTQSTVLVADIPSIIADPNRGAISLVGDSGGTSLITGNTQVSGLIFGTLSIETEHGVIYLDPEEETVISEEMPLSDNSEWNVTWTIVSSGSSPERAAAQVWRQHFGRDMAGSDDACIFTVTNWETRESVTIDLSKFDLESLID